MTPEEIRLQAEVDRLKAALRSIADQCDGILRRRWNETWELTARIQQMGARAASLIDPPDRDW